MKVFFTIVKVLFGVIALGMLAFTIYFLTERQWVASLSTVALAALFGAIAIRDLVLWLKKR